MAGVVSKRHVVEERGELLARHSNSLFYGTCAYRGYRELDFEINYWRTKTGMEVDFILNKGEVAIEVKSSSRVDTNDTRSIMAFLKEYKPKESHYCQ